jgi:hypothetical protein
VQAGSDRLTAKARRLIHLGNGSFFVPVRRVTPTCPAQAQKSESPTALRDIITLPIITLPISREWLHFLRIFSSLWNVDEFGLLFTSLHDRNLNAVEIRWPFRLGLQGCIVDRSQDLSWQRTFGHGREIVPEMLQRGSADDDPVVAFGV